MLQAASFRDIADAERLANRLKDFGLLAKIMTCAPTATRSGTGSRSAPIAIPASSIGPRI
nr:SPOR domain-containing protein [Salinicola tamaricis]